MSSGISGKTPRYGFNLISFDYPRWSVFEHQNWRLLDSLLQAALISASGIWRNATAYTVGTRVTDDVNFKTYAAQSTHVSSSTGTFAAERIAFPALWIEVFNAPIYRGAWAPSTQYNYLDIVSRPNGEFYIASAAHISGGTFTGINWTQTGSGYNEYANIIGKPSTDVVLNTISSSVRLDGIKSRKLWIDGTERLVPAVGPLLPASGLTTLTNYYIYAYWTGTAVALEASTTGHAEHPSGSGIRVKSSDQSRSLVGFARVVTGNFVDTAVDRLVRSYYNRQLVQASVATAAANTSSLTAVEYGLTRLEFICFSDDRPVQVVTGVCTQTINLGGVVVYMSIDGVFLNGTTCAPVTGQTLPVTIPSQVHVVAEGNHTCSGGVSVGSGTAGVAFFNRVIVTPPSRG